MYNDFITALKKAYGIQNDSELSEKDLKHYNFAATSNSRAKETISLYEAIGFSMNGLNILDVGCAYGGFAIEVAKKGANAYAVEILDNLYQYALLNAKNEVFEGNGTVSIYKLDATSCDFLDKLPHNFFDLIIVNDVFEHIYDTTVFIKNLSVVGNEHCSIYFKIPNGDDLGFVAKEGHHSWAGISIVDPLYWNTLILPFQANIYYRPYEYFESLFRYFGFGYIDLLNYPRDMDEGIVEKVNNEFEKTLAVLKESEPQFPPQYKTYLESALKKYEQWLKRDIEIMPSAKLEWKYLTKFWTGLASKKKREFSRKVTEWRLKTSQDENEAIETNGKFGAKPVMILRNNILSVEISVDADINQIETCFYLIHENKTVDKTVYDGKYHEKYEWTLESEGKYNVIIYIREKGAGYKTADILSARYPISYVKDNFSDDNANK